ncbi:MAG: hypothetical protein J1F18_00165 [Lachnospiraceae bacterium]|nr:hypothetical protein [Lachnospiraceae bacterium]
MLHILGLLFWLVVIPLCIGLIPANFISADKRNPGFVMLAGYFVMWAVFEVTTIPMVLFVKYDNFKVASVCFTVISILCAITGLGLMFRNRKRQGPSLFLGSLDTEGQRYDTSVRSVARVVGHVRTMSPAERIEWLLFFALLGFQLYKAAAYASFDGDDAYYVVESLIAQQADVMYRILPYTGRPTDLDVRHVLAVFPMWIAYVASKSGIHATIVSHLVIPLVIIPLGYLIHYEIGKALFCEGVLRRSAGDADDILHKENLPIFMILMGLFQIFGNVSIYTNETFFLTRTWQGKAVAGSLVIPALFWMFLWIYDNAAGNHPEGSGHKRHADAGLWILFVCVNMTAGICSSIAVFLVCVLMALTALCLAVVRRDYKVIIKMGAVCIPNVIYMAIYVMISSGYLLK